FRSYTWGLDITRTLTDAGGVGALLQIADHRSGKTYFPAYDGNGNITALVNSSTGAVAAAYEYSPFGEPLRADAPDSVVADQPFRFSTKYTDSETGLVYYGRRYYDPKCGRFVGRDTIEEKGGRNLYAFARNNAINVYDLLGMLPVMMAPFIVREDPIWDDGLNLQMDGGGGGRFIFDFGGGGGAGASIFVPPDFQFNLKDFKSAKCPELQELATHAELMDDSYNDDRVMGPSAPVAGTNFVRLTAAVAYRGTEATVSDIITDVFTQPFGISGQYSQAAAVGQQSLASFGPGVLQLGHSLGGGLAATAALATNTNAVTINPAGISYLTGLNLGLNLNNAPQLVSAWIHSGEILSGVLNPLPLIPNTNGLVSTLPAAPGSGGIVSRHRMPFVKASIWDQRVKNGCIGPD
ncbi:MAG: RHS repeat-associated core domain-containing protein, partial [Verrucomicrobia bacterium]|nr:RHS repeat-associated core domain-containing protein [Verrucomicrobiota bacterium]